MLCCTAYVSFNFPTIFDESVKLLALLFCTCNTLNESVWRTENVGAVAWSSCSFVEYSPHISILCRILKWTWTLFHITKILWIWRFHSCHSVESSSKHSSMHICMYVCIINMYRVCLHRIHFTSYFAQFQKSSILHRNWKSQTTKPDA